MRTERNQDGTYNVWINRDEYRAIAHAAHSFSHEIAIRLMGDCGLRVGEVPDVEPRHLSRHSDGRHYALEVVSGKDTTGEYADGKQRETWVPIETEQLINRYVQSAEIAPDEPIFDLTPRALMKWVRKAGDRAVEETGDSDYQRVSTHDLRRSWANHLLVEEGVSPRIVMALGGWSSYDAIEPYLAAPTEENIITSMSTVAL